METKSGGSGHSVSSSSCFARLGEKPEERRVEMDYELRIPGIENEACFAAVRWELFLCSEVRDLRRIGTGDLVAVVCDEDRPDVEHWVDVLAEAGYASEPTALASLSPRP
jgi:hypothetical protein